MSVATTDTPAVPVKLTEEERVHLVSLLEQATRETLVEAHRTDSPDFREHIQRRGIIFRSVIDKLRRPTGEAERVQKASSCG